MIQITEQVAQSVLKTIDAGLVKGIGDPVPGQMCVEAAVCYALGLPHGDDPNCVSPVLRTLKINLNDADWSSSAARASGLRRLGIAQLGSAGVLDEKEFVQRVILMAAHVTLTDCLESIGLKAEAAACRNATDIISARDAAATAAAVAQHRQHYFAAHAAGAVYSASDVIIRHNANYAIDYAAMAVIRHVNSASWRVPSLRPTDQILSDWAERVVQILIDMKAPGTQWLYLTESK